MQRIKNGVPKILALAGILGALAYLALQLKNIEVAQLHINWLLGSLSLISLTIFLAINAMNYVFMCKRAGVAGSIFNLSAVYFKSYLALYIPGKVGVLVSRIAHHQPQTDLAIRLTGVFLVESILALMSSLLITIVGASFLLFDYENAFIIVIGMALMGLLLLNPRTINYLSLAYTKFKKKESVTFNFRWIDYVLISINNALKWMILGAGLYILASSLGIVDLAYWQLLSGYSSASIVALLAFFSPSGIGVMELYLAKLFEFSVDASLAALFVVVLRIWKVLGEVLSLLLFNLFQKVFLLFNRI